MGGLRGSWPGCGCSTGDGSLQGINHRVAAILHYSDLAHSPNYFINECPISQVQVASSACINTQFRHECLTNAHMRAPLVNAEHISV